MPELSQLYDEADNLKDAGKLDEAIAKIGEALEIDETYVLGHHLAARCCSLAGKHEDAVKHALRAAELEPDTFSYTSLSVTYQRAYAGTGDHQYIQMAEDAMARSRMMGQ